jgi:hypothetical protein
MRIIKVTDPRKIFRRIHDGFIMGREITLGQDFSTGEQREDLPEYYEEVTPEDAPDYPNLTGIKIPIPPEFETQFTDDLFILNNFVIILERIEQNLVIDTCYLEWMDFMDELYNSINTPFSNINRDVWDYLKEQYVNQNFIN